MDELLVKFRDGHFGHDGEYFQEVKFALEVLPGIYRKTGTYNQARGDDQS